MIYHMKLIECQRCVCGVDECVFETGLGVLVELLETVLLVAGEVLTLVADCVGVADQAL